MVDSILVPLYQNYHIIERHFSIERVIILSTCKLLICQIEKLLTMFLDSEIAGMTHTILLLQNWDKIFLYIWKRMSDVRGIPATLYRND